MMTTLGERYYSGMMDMYDADGSGGLDQTEFVTAICANGLTDANIQSLFNAFDSDGDGYIEAGEVQSFYTNLGFRRAIPSRTLEDMVKALDGCVLERGGSLRCRSSWRGVLRTGAPGAGGGGDGGANGDGKLSYDEFAYALSMGA